MKNKHTVSDIDLAGAPAFGVQKTYAGAMEIEEIPPIFCSNQIWFPVSIKAINTDQYHGDARSFGFPVDEGPCTEVTFDYIMGVLAEDTIALRDEIRRLPKPQKVRADAFFEPVELDYQEFASDLDWTWIDKMIAENEEYDSFDDIMFAAWPAQWQQAYHQFWSDIHARATANTPILKDSFGYSLFDLDEQSYYAVVLDAPSWQDRLRKDQHQLQALQSAVDQYNLQIKNKAAMISKFNDNLKVLREFL